MSDKIQRHHLDRKAVLYVRQSSVQQVLHNRESGALQYAMRDRLQLSHKSQVRVESGPGWPASSAIRG